MANSILKNLPKSTAELEITIAWDEIKTVFDKIFEKAAKEIEVPGFRKGKAPKKLLEEKIDKKKVYEQVVKEVVPKAYQEAVSKHNLTPVSVPKIKLVKAKEGEDWQVKATLALKPTIKLKKYKEKIREIKKGKTKIWTPGDTQDKKSQEKEKKTSLDEIILALLKEVEIELSDILIEEETNRLLSNLLDQTQKLGLTVEQYLMSKGKSSEKLREEYKVQAEKNLKTQFILAEIADKENITVSQDDIKKFIDKTKDEKAKEKLQRDSYYIAYLLRQQKTLEFLNNL